MTSTILFRTTPRILLGNGSIEQIGTEVKNLKGEKVLIVTDPGIVQSGILEKVTTVLKSAQIATGVFDKVEPDPRIEIVYQASVYLHEAKYDTVIGVGGGSSLDIAKLASVMAKNPGKVSDYFGIDVVPHPGLRRTRPLRSIARVHRASSDASSAAGIVRRLHVASRRQVEPLSLPG